MCQNCSDQVKVTAVKEELTLLGLLARSPSSTMKNRMTNILGFGEIDYLF